ncbi:hypothetical protein MC885_000691 [Smutsia gigantea]|nr:hypothetical protein MC885_000691 [Smutsia gigantea]
MWEVVMCLKLKDDESLKYLTHEEKDVIMFFEETIDSLEDDFEEQVLCDSGVHCQFPWSLEESTSSHSEPEDVIDLVQPGPSVGGPECPLDDTGAAGVEPVGKEDVPVFECRRRGAERPPLPGRPVPQTLPLPPAPAPRRKELPPASPPAEHPKLPRSVPTPLVIAQMSEKLAGHEAPLPTWPSKEGRPGERRTAGELVPGDRSPWPRHAGQPVPLGHRFPSNISVSNSAGKAFNRTISRAAVSVQERRARVLATINGASFLSPRDPECRAPQAAEQRGGAGPQQGPRGRQARTARTEQAPPPAPAPSRPRRLRCPRPSPPPGKPPPSGRPRLPAGNLARPTAGKAWTRAAGARSPGRWARGPRASPSSSRAAAPRRKRAGRPCAGSAS